MLAVVNLVFYSCLVTGFSLAVDVSVFVYGLLACIFCYLYGSCYAAWYHIATAHIPYTCVPKLHIHTLYIMFIRIASWIPSRSDVAVLRQYCALM